MFKFCHFQHIQNQKLFFLELVGFTSNAETPFKSRPIPVFVLYCPPPRYSWLMHCFMETALYQMQYIIIIITLLLLEGKSQSIEKWDKMMNQ